MIEILEEIVVNVLVALYLPFGASIIFAILFMFFCMMVEENGLKTVVRSWLEQFRKNTKFRRMFVFAFYVSMILFRTLLNRNMWANPISNVIGVWSLYNAKGELTTEAIENLALFIPFTILLLWSFKEKVLGQDVRLFRVLWKSVKIVFLFSLVVELLQLFLRLGTFQLSDLFYNTLGGFVGGLIYWIGYKLDNKFKTETGDTGH